MFLDSKDPRIDTDSVRYWSDIFASDQYLIDINMRVFDIWGLMMQNTE